MSFGSQLVNNIFFKIHACHPLNCCDKGQSCVHPTSLVGYCGHWKIPWPEAKIWFILHLKQFFYETHYISQLRRVTTLGSQTLSWIRAVQNDSLTPTLTPNYTLLLCKTGVVNSLFIAFSLKNLLILLRFCTALIMILNCISYRWGRGEWTKKDLLS